MKTLLLLFLITGSSLAQNALPAINQKAPELELRQGLQTPKGQIPTLASLHGRLVILEFWATWCGGCVSAIPHLNETAEQVKDKPITFISITDEDADVVKAFLQERTMKSWVGVDKDGATFARYGILGRPQTLIIDNDGVFRAAVGPQQLNVALLNNALAGKYPEMEHATGDAAVPMEFAKGAPPPLLQVLIRPASLVATSGYLPGASVAASGGRNEIYGISLGTLLYYAEDEKLRSDRLIAPSWFNTDRYDVSTVVPAGRDDLRTKMLLQAAVDTFSLKMHREQRPAEVYVLSTTGTSKLNPSSAKPSGGFRAHPAGTFTGVSTSVERLSSIISHELKDAEVIDETGLTGHYDFSLSWNKDNISSITVALRDQLGLSLKKQTRNREFLIVDEALQPQTW